MRKTKILCLTLALVLVTVGAVGLSSCSKSNYENCEVYGKVTEINGTKVTLSLINTPEMPSGEMGMPGENVGFTMPDGNRPDMGEIPSEFEWGNGDGIFEENTEDDGFDENFGQLPDGDGMMDDDITPPEIPTGDMGNFGGGMGMNGNKPDDMFSESGEVVTLILTDAMLEDLSVGDLVIVKFGDNGKVESVEKMNVGDMGGAKFDNPQGGGDIPPEPKQ